MSNVTSILSRKSNGIISVEPSTSVFDALEIMSNRNIGSLIVMNNGIFLGLMTERDYARKVILKDKHSDETTVGDIMPTDLPRVNPRDTVEHCMKLMADGNVRYLPVFENGSIVGIVSVIDVIQETVKAQKETISNLQEFISSNYG